MKHKSLQLQKVIACDWQLSKCGPLASFSWEWQTAGRRQYGDEDSFDDFIIAALMTMT